MGAAGCGPRSSFLAFVIEYCGRLWDGALAYLDWVASRLGGSVSDRNAFITYAIQRIRAVSMKSVCDRACPYGGKSAGLSPVLPSAWATQGPSDCDPSPMARTPWGRSRPRMAATPSSAPSTSQHQPPRPTLAQLGNDTPPAPQPQPQAPVHARTHTLT